MGLYKHYMYMHVIPQTVLCPHKAVAMETVIQLPVGTTHIKITRPRLVVGVAVGGGTAAATAGKRDRKKAEPKTASQPQAMVTL